MERILALPAPVRHLLLLAAVLVLSWVGTDVIPALQDGDSTVGVIVAAALTAVLAYVTPLVTSYGVGAATAREMGARTPSL